MFTVFAAAPDFVTLVIVYPISWVVTGVAMFVTYYFVRNRAYAKAAEEA